MSFLSENIQGIIKVPEQQNNSKNMSPRTNAKYWVFMILFWLSDGDLEFDLDNDLKDHFKVRSIFLMGPPYF